MPFLEHRIEKLNAIQRRIAAAEEALAVTRYGDSRGNGILVFIGAPEALIAGPVGESQKPESQRDSPSFFPQARANPRLADSIDWAATAYSGGLASPGQGALMGPAAGP